MKASHVFRTITCIHWQTFKPADARSWSWWKIPAHAAPRCTRLEGAQLRTVFLHSMLHALQLQYTERCVDAAGFKSQINTPVGKCMQRDENTAHCFLAVAMWAKGARAEIREQRARDSREERNPRDVCRRISVFLQPMYMITDDYCNSLAHLCVTFPAQWHKFCTMGERKKNLRTDQHLWQIHTAKHQKKSKKHLFVRYLCS